MTEGKKAIPSQKRAKRRRKPMEVASRKQAIRNFCLECMGYESAEVIRCTSNACWLFPYRLGSVNKKEITAEQKLLEEFEAKKKKEAAAKRKAVAEAKKTKLTKKKTTKKATKATKKSEQPGSGSQWLYGTGTKRK